MSELETQLMLAKELKFNDDTKFEYPESLLIEIRKMLVVLRQRLDQ